MGLRKEITERDASGRQRERERERERKETDFRQNVKLQSHKYMAQRRWVDNIKMHLRELECGGMDWIDMAQERDRWKALVNTTMNLRVP
jgi:hypothetical protein